MIRDFWHQWSVRLRRLRLPLLVFLCMTLLFEGLIAFYDFDLFALLRNWTTVSVVGLAITILTGIYNLYKTNQHASRRRSRRHRSDSRRTNEDGAPDASPYAMAWQFVKSFYRLCRSSPYICFLYVVLMFVLVPAAAAHYRPVGRGLDYMLTTVEQLRYQEAPSEDAPASESSEGPDIWEEPEPPSAEAPPAEKEPVFLEEPDRFCPLSAEERQRLYFLSLPEEDLLDAVQELVASLRAQQAPNAFDGFAPPDVEAQVANADTDYSQMTSSAQLDEVINIQMTAWQEYPKYSLAWMLTNNFQEYANRYYAAGGYFETIEYYFGQSIFWAWTTLTYESASPYQVRQCLHYISLRYHDIADAAEDGSQLQQRAEALYRAFLTAEMSA